MAHPRQDPASSDPRDWDLATASAHLKSLGLDEPRECLGTAGPGPSRWEYYAQPDDRLCDQIGRSVGFYFTRTWDTRTVGLVSAMPRDARLELCAIGAAKGGVEFLWWQKIPMGYERNGDVDVPDGDLWVIMGSTVVDPESVDSYDSYLASDAWQHTRELALEHYGSSCQLCGKRRPLNVHHRTYERVGRERLADLTVLCRDCHARYHGKAG